MPAKTSGCYIPTATPKPLRIKTKTPAMGNITGACAINKTCYSEPMVGFEPTTFLRFLITSQVVSTTNRHRHFDGAKIFPCSASIQILVRDFVATGLRTTKPRCYQTTKPESSSTAFSARRCASGLRQCGPDILRGAARRFWSGRKSRGWFAGWSGRFPAR